MKSDYFTNPNWEYEKVNRASVACGPMVKWAKAQISYSDMLNNVEPLRNELNRLETSLKETKQKGTEVIFGFAYRCSLNCAPGSRWIIELIR